MTRQCLLSVMLMSLFCSAVFAAEESSTRDYTPVVVKVWPGQAPGEKAGEVGEEHVKNRDGNVIRLADVTEPTLTLYRTKLKDPTTTVLICPGPVENHADTSSHGFVSPVS